jgi:hypothetical protein
VIKKEGIRGSSQADSRKGGPLEAEEKDEGGIKEMTRADARGRRAGRSEPGGREDAQHWMGEKRLQQAEACWCCLGVVATVD